MQLPPPRKPRRSILQYASKLDHSDSASATDEAVSDAGVPKASVGEDEKSQDGERKESKEADKNPKFADSDTHAESNFGATVTMTATTLAAASARKEREALMLELLTSLSPELGFDDIAERICRLTKEFFAVDRVGFFLVGASIAL